MSSYVIQKQSRGAGAIAAHDLGAVSRASGSAFKSRAQMRSAARAPAQVAPAPARSRHSCPPNQVWDRIEQFCRPRQTKPVLAARTRAGALVAVPFTQGLTGKPLVARKMINERSFLIPTQSKQGTLTKIVDFIDRPEVTVSAGVIPGKAPASLPAAVAARNAAQDTFDETEMDFASVQVPQIAAKKSNKLLIYGGLGAAGLLIYMLARKK